MAKVKGFTLIIGNAFDGEANKLGLENPDDVTAMIKEIRADRKGEVL